MPFCSNVSPKMYAIWPSGWRTGMPRSVPPTPHGSALVPGPVKSRIFRVMAIGSSGGAVVPVSSASTVPVAVSVMSVVPVTSAVVLDGSSVGPAVGSCVVVGAAPVGPAPAVESLMPPSVEQPVQTSATDRKRATRVIGGTIP
jgi:hypothetical protein